MPLSALVVASECAPLVKVGGLADVIGALPAALRRIGVDARVLVPGYPAVLAALDARAPAAPVPAWAGLPEARIVAGTVAPDVPLYAVDCPSLYARDGTPYADAAGEAWPDDARRFGLLAHVAASFGGDRPPFGFACDVVHANDWQAGLAPAYLALGERRRAATLFTIHNLAFPGIFDAAWLPALGLPAAAFSMHGLEYHGKLAFMKAGLYYADMLSTVSPTYAREITSAPMGMGFEGLLAGRAPELAGILNGIDEAAWNPATDPRIAATYDAVTLERKAANRVALARRAGLAARDDVPLFGLVGRFSGQKGIDLVLDVADALVGLPAQLVIAGTGERALEARALATAARLPGRMAAFVAFDETLAHLVEAGADAFLMPSRFEPCGLNQMYSQRYGTPPIVHATGGLVDSVTDAGDGTHPDGTGFAFAPATAEALLAAATRAAAAWRDRAAWRRLQRNGMARDFGWEASARRYVAVYEQALARLPR